MIDDLTWLVDSRYWRHMTNFCALFWHPNLVRHSKLFHLETTAVNLFFFPTFLWPENLSFCYWQRCTPLPKVRHRHSEILGKWILQTGQTSQRLWITHFEPFYFDDLSTIFFTNHDWSQLILYVFHIRKTWTFHPLNNADPVLKRQSQIVKNFVPNTGFSYLRWEAGRFWSLSWPFSSHFLNLKHKGVLYWLCSSHQFRTRTDTGMWSELEGGHSFLRSPNMATFMHRIQGINSWKIVYLAGTPIMVWQGLFRTRQRQDWQEVRQGRCLCIEVHPH